MRVSSGVLSNPFHLLYLPSLFASEEAGREDLCIEVFLIDCMPIIEEFMISTSSALFGVKTLRFEEVGNVSLEDLDAGYEFLEKLKVAGIEYIACQLGIFHDVSQLLVYTLVFL